jgi:hypothetical protein
MKDDFISEIYKWFVAKKRKIFNAAIIIVIVSPIAIWLLYLFGEFVWGFPTELSADGMLGYLAAILSALATIFLGFVTLALSNRANKINDGLLKIQKDQFQLETQPFIMITHWIASGKKFIEIVRNPNKIFLCLDHIEENTVDVSCLSLFITNTTKSFLLANYTNGYFNNNGEVQFFALGAANQFNTKLLLNPGETKELVFYGNTGFFYDLQGHEVVFTFHLENRIAEKYREDVTTTIVMYSDPFEEGIDEWYTMLSIENYSIQKV